MKNNSIIMVIGALVIGAAGGFFGGMQYQKSQSPTAMFAGGNGGFRSGGQGGGQRGQAGQGFNRTGFRPVLGEIISSDDKSITVKLADGSTKIAFYSATTDINKSEKADKSGLVIGEKVSVFGTENTDGTVTATNISLNPVMRGPQSISPTIKL
jgi:hypothetical protein